MSHYARYTLVLSAVCLGAALGVGGVYMLTREPIARMERATEDQLRMDVLPGAKAFSPLEGDSGADTGVSAAFDKAGGTLLGYVAKGESKGYGGRLVVMVGMDRDLTITRAAVLLQNETPGLGAELGKVKTADTLWDKLRGRAAGRGVSWMDQFAGKKPGQLVLGKGIDAKSGCTVTSKAIVAAAKSAVRQVEDAIKAGEKP
jgi:Na+-translocating ferredoxin:NAD+ oxidoreductase subunit G